MFSSRWVAEQLQLLQKRGAVMSDLIHLEDSVAVRLHFGAYLVVPTWNLDVAVGLIRDRIIEAWTSKAIQALLKPGFHYVNVGANFGYYMVLGAHCVGRSGHVIAIEANRQLLPYLMRSLFWSGYPDVIKLFQCGITDVDNLTLDLIFDPQFIGGASIATRQPSPSDLPKNIRDRLWENIDLSDMIDVNCAVTPTVGHFARTTCVTRRLDTILREGPCVDVLHMDIEGSEPRAILGATEILARSNSPAIVMEWSPVYCLSNNEIEKTRAMCDFLEQRKYRFYRIRHEDFSADLPAPHLDRIQNREALFAISHSDVIAVTDLARYHAQWQSLVL